MLHPSPLLLCRQLRPYRMSSCSRPTSPDFTAPQAPISYASHGPRPSSVNWEVFRNCSQTVSECLKPNKGILFQISRYIWYIYIEKNFKIAHKRGLSEQSYRCYLGRSQIPASSLASYQRCRESTRRRRWTIIRGMFRYLFPICTHS
jgi:hypothetical protein